MSAAGVTLDEFVEHHRLRGEPVPLDVALVVAAAMAAHCTSAARLEFTGTVEPLTSEGRVRAFGLRLFEMLTLSEFDGEPDVAPHRHDAPSALVELMFELLAPEPTVAWSEVAERLDALKEDAEGSVRELSHYLVGTFPPPEAPRSAKVSIFGEALEEEIGRFDLLIARAGQVITFCLLIIATIAGLEATRNVGLWSALAAAPMFGWFTFVAYMLKRGRSPRWLPIVSTALESFFPFVFLLIAFFGEGASYALTSWAAPMLIMFMIAISAMRLRPLQPAVIGVGAGLSFPLIYFTTLRHSLGPEDMISPALHPTMQITRGVGFAMAGLIAGGLAWGLRSAIYRAERTQRRRHLFGKYLLLRELASGGMGTVHEALYCPEGGFERRVAVKTIHPHLAQEARFVAAFRREAELTARLAHPNIVQVFDFGQVENSYFLAMEFVDGVTLRDLAARDPLSPQLVAHISREILSGLTHAHGARDHDGAPLRIVHRDLSPANILVSRNGEVKIADYGVAKALHDATHTMTNTVAGNYGYMAPEQVQSDPLDERVDVFALGVVMWELLTGQRLFRRADVAATLLAVLNDEIAAPSTVRAELDEAWDTLLRRALARDPEARFASASDMLHELNAILADEGGACAEELAALVTHAKPSP